ncbi:MAG: DUF6445 family protein [Kangiellaceae bacterium]|nr:DUF6445 family protein [Kangiellaceae bacterium]
MQINKHNSRTEYNFGINPVTNVKTVFIGDEKHRLLIIDNFAADPKSLVEYACNETDFIHVRPPENFYPGIVAQLPETYSSNLYATLQTLLSEAFGLQINDRSRKYGAFSITTLKPEQLHPLMCIPHVDTVDQNQVAILLYLCDETHGGTSFFKHRETGYESLDKQRMAEYKESCMKHFATNGQPSKNYILEDSFLFKKIDSVDAKFNRLVIYHSHILHSGSININTGLPSSPSKGRLTANSFISFF